MPRGDKQNQRAMKRDASLEMYEQMPKSNKQMPAS